MEFSFVLDIMAILAICLLLFLLCLSIRNSWVFSRINELNRFENGIHVIKHYADYDTMILKFWIWDVEKFKLPNVENKDTLEQSLGVE